MATINGYWSAVSYIPDENWNIHAVPVTSMDLGEMIPIAHINYDVWFRLYAGVEVWNYSEHNMIGVYSEVTNDWLFPLPLNWRSGQLLKVLPSFTTNFEILQPVVLSPAKVKVNWRALTNMERVSLNNDGGISKMTYTQQYIPCSSIFGDPKLSRLDIAKISYGVTGDLIYTGTNGTGNIMQTFSTLNYQAETDTWVILTDIDYTNSGDHWEYENIIGDDQAEVLTPNTGGEVVPIEVVVVPPVVITPSVSHKLVLYYLALK